MLINLCSFFDKITGGKISLIEDHRIKATIIFPVWAYLPPRSQVNFGDTGDFPAGSGYMDILNFFLAHYRKRASHGVFSALKRGCLN
jgi:hypothetical protein